jgi:hypothetical protein
MDMNLPLPAKATLALILIWAAAGGAGWLAGRGRVPSASIAAKVAKHPLGAKS